MRYAEVAVDAPVGHLRTFSYSIPDHCSVEPGQLVWVPFGRRVPQGVVMELVPAPQVPVTRDILQPVEPSPLVGAIALQLARWISGYYRSSLFDAVNLFLPPGFKGQVRSRVSAVRTGVRDLAALRPSTTEALQLLSLKSSLAEGEFVKLLGRGGERELARLVQKRLVDRSVSLPRPKIVPRYECYLRAVSGGGVRVPPSPGTPISAPGLPQASRRASRQLDLLRAVSSLGKGYPLTLANKEFGYGVADALVEKGLLALEWVRVESPPALDAGDAAATLELPSFMDGGGVPQEPAEAPLILTSDQADALSRITDALEDTALEPRSFLIHGVTGSGKTEVYLRAMQHVVAQAKQAILLVPEIALTPQTLHRASARFPGRVAVIHSRLTPRQKFDQWWNIRDGNFDVVVGPRSALFAPLPNLGLIIIDEEHEWTYKQEDAQPVYHARAVALRLSQLTRAAVVLGSATPDVETYYHARRGRHCLLELPHRVRTPAEARPNQLAEVEICNMRLELREGNRGIFSRSLAQGLNECVARGQQAILFLNRRGSAPIVQCRDCGDVVTCRHCSVSLTYHSSEARLVCHRCNRRSHPPRNCRRCASNRIRHLGIGTQRVVDEVARLLPGVRVERWDADATRSGPGPEEMMRRLASGEVQVLVGTQMVAKGLHVPNITLVGVVLADLGLHLPDFRAGERTFDLLCQVAGRAGRGLAPGKVIIQTYLPEHYAILAALRQDYLSLYQREIEARRQQGNPPFNQLAHLVYQDTNATMCQRQAISLARLLRQKALAQGLTDMETVGPAPGIPERVRGRFRWHLILRGRNLPDFLDDVTFGRGWTVDMDPVNVL